jgi:hypothetical protein
MLYKQNYCYLLGCYNLSGAIFEGYDEKFRLQKSQKLTETEIF